VVKKKTGWRPLSIKRATPARAVTLFSVRKQTQKKKYKKGGRGGGKQEAHPFFVYTNA